MAEFDMGKALDDVEMPEPVPEDWYLARIIEEPIVAPNNKRKAFRSAMGDDPKAWPEGTIEPDDCGNNLIVKFRLISEDVEVNGRGPLTLWLPFPEERDKELRSGNGMIKYDEKMLRIAELAEAAEGSYMDGTIAVVNENSTVGIYIKIGQGMDGSPQNNVDWFQQPDRFKTPEDIV